MNIQLNEGLLFSSNLALLFRMMGWPSVQSGQLSETQFLVAHSQMSYPPERIPLLLMYPTLTMSLSLDNTLPNCWLVVPWRIVVLMCSRISAVLRGLSARNFLIFSLIRTVFIFPPQSFCQVSTVGRDPLGCRTAVTDITVLPRNGSRVTLTDLD